MKYLCACTAVIMVVGVAATCQGHGSPVIVNVADGKLTISGGLPDDRGYAQWVFADADEEAPFIPAPGGILLAGLPGFEISGMAPGQQISLAALSRPDFTDAATPQRWLWYWDAATELVSDVPQDALLEVASSRGFLPSAELKQATFVGSSSVKMADLLASDIGEHKHLLQYVLDDSPAVATGVYGFFARVASPDYTASEPFLITLNHGLDAATFQRGAKLINAAARLPGDYDGDDDADGADLLVWQRSLGSTTALAADGSRNDVVDHADLGEWRENYGRVVAGAAVGAAHSVPEPGAAAGLCTGGGLLIAAAACRRARTGCRG